MQGSLTDLGTLRTRAARLWRAVWPVVIVAGGAITCDAPTGPARRIAQFSLRPVFSVNAQGQFAGLTIDQVRLTAVRPPSETVATRTIPFPADSATVRADLSVQVSGTETLTVYIDLLAAGAVVFSGSVQVEARPGDVRTNPTPIPVTYRGPGSNIAVITVSPPDSGAAYGAVVPFRVTARDSQNNAVPSFYVGWSASSTVHSINAAGLFTAGSARAVVWVRAHTPTGIWDSTRITVAPVPSAVQVVSGSGQNGTAGAALGQPLVARVIAQDNGPVVGIPVTFAAASGGGSVNPASAVTDLNGQAQTTATLGPGAGANTFTASVSGLAAATFSGTATSALPPTLTFTAQPTSAVAGSSVAPGGGILVAARDAQSNAVTSFTGAVTLAIGSNPGGGTLTGTATVNATAGVAAFTNLSIDKAGTGYTLSASAVGLTVGTSSAFNVTAGAAVTLALSSGGGQSGAPSAALPLPIVARVTDTFGNGVSGVTVNFAVTGGGGSVNPASAQTDANGLASTTWTLGATLGAQALSVTSTGLGGSPLTVSANASSIVSTTVTPHRDTVTAINGTRTLIAQARDGQSNPVAGSFTWSSDNTIVATVSGAGVVTAHANGNALITAREAGGTQDTARIVVERRIASINVTPGARNIYLTRTFTFSATAVDGLGTAIPTQPTFTWSSTAPAVATVDPATGLVTGVGLGSTQIRATSGAVIGTAAVQIITPITRIAVVVDTVNAFKTDTFTLTSLGLTRTYRAIAHDTLDAVMPGVSFTWRSSNGSVAVLDNVTATTARATSAANGVTAIQATAQNFTSAPGAFLTVAQVLASIELGPPAANPTATIGISGTMGLVARGKDANNRYIAGGSFAFASSNAAIATVNPTTGLVAGVANGTANLTATSGAITSNQLLVTVGGGSVPSIISFGRDTVSVGRGASASIPILLSTPAASNLTVNLAVADTFAFWSQASVVIPQGQTSVNATLNGRNAGTTTITATDGSGLGYSAGSSVAAVTANMNLQAGSYVINTTDIVTTQVRLSDPSPAGGTYVSFNYGTAGIAQVSPDPAFIPTGQLAADIQIRGLSAGTTTITPSAIGVNGSASSFQALAPVLTPSTTQLLLGQGQYESAVYVYTPTTTNLAVPVTLTSSDTNVVTVTPAVTIPAGQNYSYFTISARAVGTATISMAAPGWTASSGITLRSSTPYIGICCGTSLFTTSPATNVTVYAEDSTRNIHYRTNSLVVRLRSTDSTVMRVLDTLVTIGPGQYYTSAGRVAPAGLGGAAYIIAEASGHQPDSTRYTVQGPPLAFSWGTNRIGVDQIDYNLYVYTPNNVTAPLTVTLANPDSSILGAPPTVIIPANTNYVYFNVRGKATGSITLTASAPGYNNASATYIVTTPRVVMSGGVTLNNFSPPRGYTVYSTDSVGNAHYRIDSLHVSLRSTDAAVITTDTSAVIPAGQYYTVAPPAVTPVGLGTAQVVASTAGHRPDTNGYAVVTPKLNFNVFSYTIGRRQHRTSTEFYVYTPDNRATPLAVTLTQLRPTVDSLTATALTIPAGRNYEYFTFYGLTNGGDTLVATAPGYAPDTMYLAVTTPRLTNCCMPGSATTTNPPFTMTVYATDSLGSAHYASDTVTVRAVSSDPTVIQPTQQYFHILKNDYYAQSTVTIVGPGTASITYSDSAGSGYGATTTGSITVTGPSLAFSNSVPVLGMRQTHPGGWYVYTPNNVVTPLVVNLVSTDPRVVSVPPTVTIPANSNYVYFNVTALDTLGTIQVQATATGYNAAAMNIQVTQPKLVVTTTSQLNTTGPAYPVTVYAADANGNPHYVTENVTVSLLSTAPSVAILDSGTVTILAGSYYHNTSTWRPGIVGASQIQASDPRAVQYQYTAGAFNVNVITPSLNFSWSTLTLGVGQYEDHYVSRPDAPTASLAVNIAHATVPRVSTEVAGVDQATITIPSSQYSGAMRVVGLSAGSDTLTASASSPAHNPDVAVVNVGLGTLNPLGGWPTTLAVGDSALVTLYPRDPNGTNRYVRNATTFTLAPNARLEFRTGGTSSTVTTQVTVPADGYFVQFYVKALSSGTGNVDITATNYQPFSITVSIP